MAMAGQMSAGSVRRPPAVRGVSVETQARLDAGLMSAKLPWQVTVYLLCVIIPIWFNAGPLLMSTLWLRASRGGDLERNVQLLIFEPVIRTQA